jgi:GDP-L-fucose synthase
MILVTGGRGPLGSAFQEIKVAEKSSNYLFPTSNDVDLTIANRLQDYVESSSHKDIQGIIHLAAFSGGAQLSKDRPAEMITKNLLMAINILEFARLNQVKRVILCLSTTCYSPELISPDEDQLHVKPSNGVDYAYAWAKRSMEPLMKAYNQQYGLEVSCVVINGIIGPGMNFTEGQMILPAALIQRFESERHSLSPNFSILTDGSEIREYTYSYDLARAIDWCFHNQAPDTVLNIGSTEQVTVRFAAEKIADCLGIEIDLLRFGNKELISRAIQSTDNSRFRDLSGFQYTNFQEAITKTVEWYLTSRCKDE